MQFAGTEPTGGTANPDGGGTGPLYIFPGAYWFPSGSSGTNMTNPIFVGGLGDSGESGIGAIRGAGALLLQGKITLISNARIGSGNAAPLVLGGQVTGPYSLELCSAATVNGEIGLSNSLNNWTGTTTMNARNAADVNIVIDYTNEVIPNGVGFGNVVMNGNTSTGTIIWNLNGWNETINGLSTTTVAPTGLTGTSKPINCFISNQSLTISSTLAVGDNNSSGSFGGNITAGQGIVNLVKIGDGVETLTSTNTFTGFTTISNGALAIGPGGAISNTSSVTVESGATLDISHATTPQFTLAQPVNLNGGTLLGNTLNVPGALSILNLTNGSISVDLNPNTTNVFAGSVTTGGTTNLINILSVAGITGYPSSFTVIQYSGSLGGAGLNIGIGAVPSPVTGGYVSNDTVNQRIVLVLTNGPKSQVWTGLTDGTTWDVDVTTNWIGFNTTPDTFNNADSVQFDDTILLTKPSATNITLAPSQPVLPSAIVVSNANAYYNFGGSGEIGGGANLVKLGTGSLIISNTGGNYFTGGITISNGGTVVLESSLDTISGGATIGPGSTLQIGVGNGGTMPSGSVDDEGSLVLDSGTLLAPIIGNIGGAGSFSKLDPTFLVLAGNNSFTGGLTVASGGTIQADNSDALSTNTAIFANGSTLDINGQDLGAVTVTVSGTGVGGVGAIINSGGAAENGLQNVVMAGPATFGGIGRWDIRNNPGASLSTGGNAYDLTKIGANQVSLVGVTVDANLNNINVNQGIFSVQEGTTSIGNPTANLTVSPGGTLDFYAASGSYQKNFILNGDGVTTTLEIESGTATMSGPMAFNNNCLVSLVGTSLTLASGASGTGTMSISGPGELQLQGTLTYTGPISLTQGTLEFDSINASGGATTTVGSGCVLQSGSGSVGGVTGPVQVQANGFLNPGGSNQIGTLATGPLTLNNATVVLDEGTSASLDSVAVTGGLTLTGVTTLLLNPEVGQVSAGIFLTNITYSGALSGTSNNLQVVSTIPGFTYSLLDPATRPGAIVVSVVHVPQLQTWRGGATGAANRWDVGVTKNWIDNSSNNIADVFSQSDNVTFDDTAVTANVTVAVPVSPLSITFNNFNDIYDLTGPGALVNVPSLAVGGSQMVILDNGGSSNSITGGVNNPGVLQLGNNDTNGTIGAGNITNNGTLYFDHSDTLAIPGNISGTGGLVQTGSGVTVLTGNNSNYYGSVIVSNGTLRLGSGTSLPTVNNLNIVVSNGATLDITNNENIGTGTVTVGGSGVGGAGAIINSSGSTTFVAPNLAYIQMTGDLTVGGTGRLDLRDATGTGFNAGLDTGGVPMNFIKAGVNQFQMTGVQVDQALSNITVEAGELGLQANMSGLGNPTNLLTVWSNATLQFYQLSNTMVKVLILSNDATVDDSSGPAVWGGPVTLNGSNIFDVAANLLIDNNVGGSGSLLLTGGTLVLSQSNTYSGQTIITTGTLQFTNDNGGATNGSIASSSLISVGGGANIDVSLLSPSTFEVFSGQTLTGGGSILGNLAVNSGATITPTAPGASLTVTNALSLAGTTIMPISKSPLLSSALATLDGNITYGGALIVTNIAGTLTGGESFQLFKSGGGGYGGYFSTITLPSIGSGLSWNTSQLSVTGTISVAGTLKVLSFNPAGVSRSGTSLNITGSGGSAGGTYYVLSSTNLALPLAQWTPIETNSFDGSGDFNFSVPTTNAPNEYFTIEE
ncbi:MAG TPA: autotransporter-associated beta strand repeat-containing protein [Verrucomicrobiae bacterium]|nr:autotransporter-associated beta strand repeat-containing protein [Verrucomicrobiae bacterium]